MKRLSQLLISPFFFFLDRQVLDKFSMRDERRYRFSVSSKVAIKKKKKKKRAMKAFPVRQKLWHRAERTLDERTTNAPGDS